MGGPTVFPKSMSPSFSSARFPDTWTALEILGMDSNGLPTHTDVKMALTSMLRGCPLLSMRMALPSVGEIDTSLGALDVMLMRVDKNVAGG